MSSTKPIAPAAMVTGASRRLLQPATLVRVLLYQLARELHQCCPGNTKKGLQHAGASAALYQVAVNGPGDGPAQHIIPELSEVKTVIKPPAALSIIHVVEVHGGGLPEEVWQQDECWKI
jgi:hypothetical protein